MPALMLQQSRIQDNEPLRERLMAECKEVEMMHCHKARIVQFLIEDGVEHLSDIDYQTRERFGQWIVKESTESQRPLYMLKFDKIKQYSLSKEILVIQNGKTVRPPYENTVLFLAYHPNSEIRNQFLKATKKEDLVWDFTKKAPEQMKRQVYSILHYILENREPLSKESDRKYLLGLRYLYDFCIRENISDIEQMELSQAERFIQTPMERIRERSKEGILTFCRKALFVQAEEINWNAHVWFMERLHLQPERMNKAKEVNLISFVEVTNRTNRELLKKYIRYGLGITNIAVSTIRTEQLYVRKFLAELNQPEDMNVCMVTTEQMNQYFRKQRERDIRSKSYNGIVMAIQHFFNFLLARQYIERIPFDTDCILKKLIPQHNDRSVAPQVYEEILAKLHTFPETIRLMYLHLWGIGLRISEVCTLKGDAYYVQGEDAWIQVYQVKMRNYKRIPIPDALYKLMRVYLKKHNIKADDYVFQNTKGGAYRSATFSYNMLKHCELNNIQGGEYLFRSHDYRHTIATQFYDTGVPLQSIRDYLGHDYEEMTEQYIDYMPKKIAKASEEFFSGRSLLATMRGGENENG